jgi:glycosyltransferase involved in cell wall biosynthesis
MSMNIQDLTIAIPVKNEQTNLAGCLQAIGKDFAKKIVIIDSGSTDATIEIAKKFGAEVVDFQWNGKFPKKRNWYLRNYTPETKWVMFLDADEYMTEAFKQEIRSTLPTSTQAGYWLKYTIYFLGKELKGGYPLSKLALFRVGAGEYEKIDEQQWSHLDMEIHEHPVLEGTIGTIESKIDHQDFRGVSHYIKKHDEYANWEASRYLKVTGDKQNTAAWTWKQKIKYKLMDTPLIGPFFFLGSFFLMGGFRDGARGFSFAILKASYFTQIYCKIKELQLNQNSGR